MNNNKRSSSFEIGKNVPGYILCDWAQKSAFFNYIKLDMRI